MTDQDFEKWMEHHATLFWMTTPADILLFKIWKPLVLPYRLEDFMEGSDAIAIEKGGSFRTEHLTLIFARINGRMREESLSRIEQENRAEGRFDCRTCDGVGIVTVPHQNFIREGKWRPPYPTMGIYCRCNLGRAKFETCLKPCKRTGRLPPKPLPFDVYETRFPDWQNMLAQRSEAALNEAKARGIARYADTESPLKNRQEINRILETMLKKA